MTELTTEEARKRLDVSPHHVRRLLRAGKLDGCQLSSGAWLVDEFAIAAGLGRDPVEWLESDEPVARP